LQPEDWIGHSDSATDSSLMSPDLPVLIG